MGSQDEESPNRASEMKTTVARVLTAGVTAAVF